MTDRVTLSPNDSLWLNMDTPENLMIIESVMWFAEPLDPEGVVATLQHRLVEPYPVFTWRPERAEGVVGSDHWVADPGFDVRQHVTFHDLGDAPGHDAIQRFLQQRMSEPLPRDRPLWQAHVLTGDGVSAVVLRFHHAIADGTALVRVLLGMTTETAEEGLADLQAMTGRAHAAPEDAHASPIPQPDAEVHPVEPTPLERAHHGPFERARNAFSHLVTLPVAAGVVATNSAANLVHMLDPDTSGSWVSRLADQARGGADTLDKLIVGTAPDALPFGRPGIVKQADWAPGYDLGEVKRVAKARGATVNDVMLAALSGALRRYVLARGEVPQDVVTMIPVNLRPWDAPLPAHLGNKFALVALELPLAAPTPAARLAEAKARMDVVKQGPEALVTFGLAHAIGSVGAVTGTLSRQMIAYFGNKAFGVTTNVPGPPEPRYFAGREMVGVLGWVPGASHQTLGVCIFSYNGSIRVGFKADVAVIPDVEQLVAAFDEEMADIIAETDAALAAAAAQGPAEA
ncbi:MAG TPA: WS/DGAT domain-containing protein [Candidatus Nanopelagicales bacterium]